MHTVFVMASPRTGLRIFQRYGRREKNTREKERKKGRVKEQFVRGSFRMRIPVSLIHGLTRIEMTYSL